MNELDGGTSLCNPQPAPREYLLVDARVKVGNALGEIDRLIVDPDRPERRCTRLTRDRQVLPIGRQEPTDRRTLELELTGHPFLFGKVNLQRLHAAEQPEQEIEEVNADVGCNATRSFDLALP